jgi:hypothetical protein
MYNTHMKELFKDLGLDSQRVKTFASKFHVHSVNYTAKLVQPDVLILVPLPALVRSWFQAKPATLLDPLTYYVF